MEPVVEIKLPVIEEEIENLQRTSEVEPESEDIEMIVNKIGQFAHQKFRKSGKEVLVSA